MRASIPDDRVYRMAKAFREHVDEAHAMAEWMKDAANLDLATKHVARALHPGAERCYREKGPKIWPAYSLEEKRDG